MRRNSRLGSFPGLPQGALRALGILFSYGIWVLGFRLLILTLITYFLMSSQSRFQEISDVFGSNELALIGVSALLFVLLMRMLNPLTSTTTDEIFTPHRFEKRFAPGFLHGAVLALGVTLAFLLSGLYRYLGFFIQFEEVPLALGSVLLRVFSLVALAYCEEFIFRHKILNYFRRHLPDAAAAVITALGYCAIKMLQFDLGVMHILTLFLLSLTLAVRTVVDGDFVRGAGFWAGLLIVFHPLLSLPLLGNEFQGVLLVKYQVAPEAEGAMSRFLSGGVGGPLSSFALQILLVLDIGQGIFRNKKLLVKTSLPLAK